MAENLDIAEAGDKTLASVVDEDNPKYLVPRVNKSIWKNFVGRVKEILEEEYDRRK